MPLPDGLLITPSSLPCKQMVPEDLVELDGQGLVRALITERGVTPASEEGLSRLYGAAAVRANAAAARG